MQVRSAHLGTAAGLLFLVGALSPGRVAAQDVLVWSSGSSSFGAADMATWLMATGNFTSVTGENAGSQTLTDLLAYDAVLYYSNTAGPGTGAARGDVLADYADGGGRLVLCTFAFGSGPGATLEGRIIDDGLSPLTMAAPSLFTNVGLDTTDGSDFWSGVAALDVLYHDDVVASPGAVVHGTFIDGRPVVVTLGNVVGLSFFPDDSFGNITGDHRQLITNALTTPECTDLDGDLSLACAGDCDDAQPTVAAGFTELCDGLDNDCDGTLGPEETDDDGDGLDECSGGDCDDGNAAVFPGAPEVCDGADSDCDGTVPADEVDGDGDGALICSGLECDDNDAENYGGNVEVCDGEDNDCDGLANADADLEVDVDGDGVRSCLDCDDDEATVQPGATEVCDGLDNDCDGSIGAVETDGDGDGWTPCAGDCDDADGANDPDNTEACDGQDNDCDGTANADGNFEVDIDGDGFLSCDDCDDFDAFTFPGQLESCDGLDNDCDGGLPLEETDQDGDGRAPCEGDCDDGNAGINIGEFEGCDGIDTDCDGDPAPAEYDDDFDGMMICEGDCDDTNPDSYAGAPELCEDGLDNDCDGQFDGGDSDCAEQPPPGTSTCDGCATAGRAPGGALLLVPLLWIRRRRASGA